MMNDFQNNYNETAATGTTEKREARTRMSGARNINDTEQRGMGSDNAGKRCKPYAF